MLRSLIGRQRSFLLQFRSRASRDRVNFQGSNDPSLIVHVQSPGGGRVDLGELLVQSCGTLLRSHPFPLMAQFPVRGWSFENTS